MSAPPTSEGPRGRLGCTCNTGRTEKQNERAPASERKQAKQPENAPHGRPPKKPKATRAGQAQGGDTHRTKREASIQNLSFVRGGTGSSLPPPSPSIADPPRGDCTKHVGDFVCSPVVAAQAGNSVPAQEKRAPARRLGAGTGRTETSLERGEPQNRRDLHPRPFTKARPLARFSGQSEGPRAFYASPGGRTRRAEQARRPREAEETKRRSPSPAHRAGPGARAPRPEQGKRAEPKRTGAGEAAAQRSLF